MDVILVAAIAENGVIGRGNALPWRLKSDMAHFRALTMGKPVVMGRKTYQSIGRPLKGRTAIVVSRDRAFAAGGVVIAPSVDAALTVAKGDSLRRAGLDRFGLRGPLLGQPRLSWRPAQCTARQCECGRSRQRRTVGVGGCVFRGQQLALRSGDIGDRTDSVAIGGKGCIERGS